MNMKRLDRFEGGRAQLVLRSGSSSQTEHMGRVVGECIPAGTVLALTGGLGAGKTVFVKGLCKGLGVRDRVLSPTFILLEEYRGVLPVYHFDLYRLKGTDEVEEIGVLDAIDGTNVVVVEWADRLPPGWLGEDIVVNLEVVGENERRLALEAPIALIELLKREKLS